MKNKKTVPIIAEEEDWQSRRLSKFTYTQLSTAKDEVVIEK